MSGTLLRIDEILDWALPSAIITPDAYFLLNIIFSDIAHSGPADAGGEGGC